MADIRIGHVERATAQAQLERHRDAGRLDPDEFAERAAKANVARTRSDLDTLFEDLPGSASSALGDLSGRIWAASGTIAVILFFILGFAVSGWAWAWLVFLVVPVIGLLSGRSGHGRERDRHSSG